MPSKMQSVTHTFGGGWATALGESVDVAVDQSGKVQIPFLTIAENVYFDFDGGPLKIGGIYPEHLEDRELVRLEELPPYLVDGLLAVEDRRFHEHHGVSLRGIAREDLGWCPCHDDLHFIVRTALEWERRLLEVA